MGKTIQAAQKIPARGMDPDRLLSAQALSGPLQANNLVTVCVNVRPVNAIHNSAFNYLYEIPGRDLTAWLAKTLGYPGLTRGSEIPLPEMIDLSEQLDETANGLKVVLERQRLSILEQIADWPEFSEKIKPLRSLFTELIHLDYSDDKRLAELKKVVSAVDTAYSDASDTLTKCYPKDSTPSQLFSAKGASGQSYRNLVEARRKLWNEDTTLGALNSALCRRESVASVPRRHDSSLSEIAQKIITIRLWEKATTGQEPVLENSYQNAFEAKIDRVAAETEAELQQMTAGFAGESLDALFPKN